MNKVNIPSFSHAMPHLEDANPPFDHVIPDLENLPAPFDHAIPDFENLHSPYDDAVSNTENVDAASEDDGLQEENVSTLFPSSQIDTSEQYLPLISTDATCPSSAEDSLQRKAIVMRLHTIFTIHKATTRLQDAILKFLREVPLDVVRELPLCHSTLRPHTIHHERYPLFPGEMIYFGVENVLSLPGLDLFDRTLNTIRLIVSIDGLPLCQNANGVGFWPILAAVDQYPVFIERLRCAVVHCCPFRCRRVNH